LVNMGGCLLADESVRDVQFQADFAVLEEPSDIASAWHWDSGGTRLSSFPFPFFEDPCLLALTELCGNFTPRVCWEDEAAIDAKAQDDEDKDEKNSKEKNLPVPRDLHCAGSRDRSSTVQFQRQKARDNIAEQGL
jgi:hypothetical protein